MENEKKASKQPQQSSVCETEKHLLFFFSVGVGKIINITYFLFVFGIKKESKSKRMGENRRLGKSTLIEIDIIISLLGTDTLFRSSNGDNSRQNAFQMERLLLPTFSANIKIN